MKLAIVAFSIVVAASAFATSPQTHRAAGNFFHLDRIIVTTLPSN